MDLAKQAQIVDSIHDTLSDFVGQKLRVRANMGRSKIVESEGVLMQVHPKLFIMEVKRLVLLICHAKAIVAFMNGDSRFFFNHITYVEDFFLRLVVFFFAI